jgi:glutamate 5-kinase
MALISFKRGTQAQFNAATKNADTLYFTTDTNRLFLGDKPIAEAEREFDVIQSFTSDVTTGVYTLTCIGDTRTKLDVAAKSKANATQFMYCSGSYNSSTDITTYTATNATYNAGVYVFRAGIGLIGAGTANGAVIGINEANQAKATKIYKFELSMQLLTDIANLNWGTI